MTVRGYAGRLNGGFCYRVGVLPEQIASVPLLEQNVVLAVSEAWPLGKDGPMSPAPHAGERQTHHSPASFHPRCRPSILRLGPSVHPTGARQWPALLLHSPRAVGKRCRPG